MDVQFFFRSGVPFGISMKPLKYYVLFIITILTMSFILHMTSNLMRGRDCLTGMSSYLIDVTLMALAWKFLKDFYSSRAGREENDRENPSLELTKTRSLKKRDLKKYFIPALVLVLLAIRIQSLIGRGSSPGVFISGSMLTTLLTLATLLGAWFSVKMWLRGKRESRGSVQLYSEYKDYLRSQKLLEQQKKVSYETFPTPLSFEEWKKVEKDSLL
jgi:hypothetical protein